ncbi:molybdate ABC transporter permease subunit [Vibrio agarivorans]|uniref:molybdate ABC transporter permease subunit n=1 Tax=Vibrio agarivorans TaxID=153622 RepID=UPI0025B46809|nr:molybdate ABC transporter permease subunit [Vibrio agarivorans]MDN3663411.1 molybdate ABC transporter permease subunit [Vibrio agarivorans]
MFDWQVVSLTLKLATVVTIGLLITAVPLAWWLSQTQSRLKNVVASLTTLPMVLPPTVLGFYLLVCFSPNTLVGSGLQSVGIGPLPFSFSGIALACLIHSLPFVVQPLVNGFESLGKAPFEVAATLGCSPVQVFYRVALPLAWPSIFSSAILGFCHTLGEFGIVLMIGGNIPGSTRVMSVEIYNLVESMQFEQAHQLSAMLLGFSFVALLLAFGLNHFAMHKGRV